MWPQRVLMTADAVGGVWTYAIDLAGALTEGGVELVLAVDGPPPSEDQREAARAIPGLSLIETGRPLDWTADSPESALAAAGALQALARELRPDLVHLNSPALAAEPGFDAPTLGVCHSCLATWWAAVKSGPPPLDFRWRIDLQRRGMSACDLLAAPSRSFAAAIAATYGRPAPIVIHNGRQPTGAQAQGRREPLAFTAGRLWDEGKNLAVLDRAAELCAAPVFAAGPAEGPGGASAIQLRSARPLGRLPAHEIGAWLARSRLFVSSALYEPFGLGVLEAAQAGCALLLSDIPTFRELWDGAAVFADPLDPASFAARIDAILADECEADRLGALARDRAARFGLASAGARTLEAYRRLGEARAAA